MKKGILKFLDRQIKNNTQFDHVFKSPQNNQKMCLMLLDSFLLYIIKNYIQTRCF